MSVCLEGRLADGAFDEEELSVLFCTSVDCVFGGELELLVGELADADRLPSATVVCTGLRTHRRICLFKLDITPKRRPQVSQTKADDKQSELNEIDSWARRTFFTRMDKQVLRVGHC